jgi:cholesterol transport system auxiliary component
MKMKSLLRGVGSPLLAAVALLGAGCVTVDIGKDTATQPAQFRILDTAAAPSPAAQHNGRQLVIAPQASPSIDDSFALAFSRAPNQRAAYQFATWTDRPSNRLGQLLVDRLSARRAFASVALAGRGVAGDLQLNLIVDDFLHDAATSPGTARVEVTAEMVDRGTRRLVARQRFSATAPVAEANSAGAAAALSAASSRVLDQLVAWAEANATAAVPAPTR